MFPHYFKIPIQFENTTIIIYLFNSLVQIVSNKNKYINSRLFIIGFVKYNFLEALANISTYPARSSLI